VSHPGRASIAMNSNLNRLDPSQEDAYWQGQFNKEHYYVPGASWDDYRSAYRAGYEGYDRYRGRPYVEVEENLRADWERGKGATHATWDKVKHAVRAAWHRMERAMPGDADNDGR
jgi:hypothetical protein